MDDKKDILTDVFRERLKDYKHPVPDDLWEKIDQDLTNTPSRPRHKTAIFTGLVAAAACIALLIIGTHMLNDDFANQSPEENIFAIQKNNKEELIQIKVDKEQEKLIIKENVPPGKTTPINRVVEKNIDEMFVEKVNDTNEDITAPKQEEEIKPDASEEETKKENRQNQTLPENQYNFPNKKRTNKNNNVSYALALGNSGFGAPNSSNLGHYAQSDPVSVVICPGQARNNIKNRSIDYKMPLSMEISVRKHLTEEWALETGLVYTYLASTEKLKILEITTQKTDINLSYVGLPIKGIYSFYNTKNISIYASAGGMVEKCIYGKQKINDGESKTLDIPELQWSLSGHVGINYKLINHLGVFLEPGLGYYFDDGSKVETIRKDSPLNFNIQAGIRLTY